MNFPLRQKVNIAFGLALLLLGTLGVISYSSTIRLTNASYWVVHTQTVISTIDGLRSSLDEAGLGPEVVSPVVGGIAAGSHQHIVEKVHQEVWRLRQLTVDNARQQEYLHVLQPVIITRLATPTTSISDNDSARRKIQTVLIQMEDEEQKLLRMRIEWERTGAYRTRFVIFLLTVFTFGLTALSLFFINSDITQRLRTEDALRRAHEEMEARVYARTKALSSAQTFLRTIIDAVPNLVFVKDTAYQFTLANRATAEVYGMTTESIVGKNDADLNASPEEVGGFLADDHIVLETGQDKFIAEERITDVRGQVLWLQTVKRRISLPGDEAFYVLGVATDITSRKQAEAEIIALNYELTRAYDETIQGWSRALDLRDKETEGHSQRVTEMTLTMARSFGLGDTEMMHIRWGALLHDIGKMGIPDIILLKPGPLTEEEWVIMRLHPLYALQMLSPIEFLRPALDIPYSHHEKWDGTGYPLGIAGEQIPLCARIFAVADVYDALRSDRPYRKGWPEARVREHIENLSGTHFDPRVVQSFLSIEAP